MSWLPPPASAGDATEPGNTGETLRGPAGPAPVASHIMEDHENPGERWLTTREARRRLGIDARSLYRLIDEGRLPAYRDGRDLRLAERDVEAYGAEHPPTP